MRLNFIDSGEGTRSKQLNQPPEKGKVYGEFQWSLSDAGKGERGEITDGRQRQEEIAWRREDMAIPMQSSNMAIPMQSRESLAGESREECWKNRCACVEGVHTRVG
jgi:hypothetical protein